jgi:AAA+ superfamily predicted ATPase
VAERRRRILRFFGPRGDLLAAESPGIVVYDSLGRERLRSEIAGFLDIAAVGEELWAVTPRELVRVSLADGREVAREPLAHIDPAGRFLQSSTAPQLPVWHAAQPAWLRAKPARTEAPGPGGDLILPIADGRWLLWQHGQLRLWRTIGEAWRRPLGDHGAQPVDAQLVLDGRLFVLATRRAQGATALDDSSELKLSVVATSDGAQTTQLRVAAATQLAFATRRGIAAVRSGNRLSLIDLRFGRWLRDLALPAGVTDIAVDESLSRIALGRPDGLELVRPDALAALVDDDHDGDGRGGRGSRDSRDGATPTNGAHPEAEVTFELSGGQSEPVRVEPQVAADNEPWPEGPLLRLVPAKSTATATSAEIRQANDLALQWIGARCAVAIAHAWDTGRISRPDHAGPPVATEVAGLLGLSAGLAPDELATAEAMLASTEQLLAAARSARAERLTPIDVLQRDFGLSELAVEILLAIAAPRLRGELARVYGILANDPARPVIDEHLLGLILSGVRRVSAGATGGPMTGAAGGDQVLAQDIARELDGDRPLRRFGLVRVGAGDRLFAALTVDPLLVRILASQSPDGEPDPYLRVRTADRTLDELHLPRPLVAKALRYLASPDGEPARIVVRGRTGTGRHTLLAALAARANRSLGIIDLSLAPRDSAGLAPREGGAHARDGGLAPLLDTLLKRALLRGLVPCIDGLEAIASDDPDTRLQLQSVLRNHPGPLAIRLPADAQAPLDPGYLVLDIPQRNERERDESWRVALERHRIPLSDASELAARFRVGPGIIDRVCAEVAHRTSKAVDAAGWARELDEAVRQHLENRLGRTATRITRLASWADIVLPEDIVDSLLELTARVRHRRRVYEEWGFDRAITSARGITALFQGSPGTGKTMVAGVIARDLGLELYRVDVSRITSKWIGETEKNLGALFDAAEDGQVMLLFDEADSLFGKRTDVKSSVDRYANMEVNYLLQRLDSFEGIAILTTNFGNAIDPAFKRRLTYRVTFPFPDEEMREQLWKSLIPPQVPVQGKLDFASLSQRFRLSGGYIRNAALRAAFLAAEEGVALTHDHLERAIRMEFREIGKLADSGTLE